MTVELRRSPLACHSLADASTAGLSLAERPFLAMVNLRVDAAGAQRVGAALGFPLPVAPNTVTEGGPRSALWLGPTEWLVVGPGGDAPELVALLNNALGDEPGSVVDVSANRTTIEVGGPHARELLEKGCALDLHPRAFNSGRCAQTILARAQVVLWQTTDGYRLLVRGSFAGYLADWLVDAAGEFSSYSSRRRPESH